MDAPVFLPTFLAMVLADWEFLAVRDGREALGRYSQDDHVVFGHLSTPGAQREIVLGGAPLIAMTFDLNSGSRVAFEPVHVGFQSIARARLQVIAVECEVDILERTLCG